MISKILWRIVAWFVCLPAVTDWLIERANRTPYTHIISKNGDVYMGRWWLFNPYFEGDENGQEPGEKKRLSWLPSIRIHHIMRPDLDRHLHDHPWNARTIVLRGSYTEERRVSAIPPGVRWFPVWSGDILRAGFERVRGYTGRLMFGEYHRIREVSEGGVWTLFITWRKQGTWGFSVNDTKVPWRQYLGIGTNEERKTNVRAWAEAVATIAENNGMVVTIEREALQPLAMRNARSVVRVRAKLER